LQEAQQLAGADDFLDAPSRFGFIMQAWHAPWIDSGNGLKLKAGTERRLPVK